MYSPDFPYSFGESLGRKVSISTSFFCDESVLVFFWDAWVGPFHLHKQERLEFMPLVKIDIGKEVCYDL